VFFAAQRPVVRILKTVAAVILQKRCLNCPELTCIGSFLDHKQQKNPAVASGILSIIVYTYSAETFPFDLAITSSAMLFGAGA
jgi:hypothetical protein